MTKEELKETLRLHQLWLQRDKEGRYADLSSANLCSANLCYANLSYANLSSANLRYANLCETIFDKINWLAWIGITVNHLGKGYGYKLVNAKGEGVYNGGINYLSGKTFSVPEVDPNVNKECSYGINLATLTWCFSNKKADDNRILLMEFQVMDGKNLNVICPIASDGKFRVRECRKVGEVDWNGNLITREP